MRWQRILSQKRPAVGGEARELSFFLIGNTSHEKDEYFVL